MPLLFSLGQHRALEAIQSELHDEEFLFAYLDDIYAVVPPERVGAVHTSMQQHLWEHSRIRVHSGKTQVWNRGGVRPNVCDVLERIARAADPDARVWRGSGDTDLLEAQQGMKVLGTPLGHPSYVEAYLQKKVRDQQTFLERIPAVQDLQSSWSLLVHCASARSNYLLRVVTPESVANYARLHDDGMWRCFCRMMRIDPTQEEDIRSMAGMPLILGGLGLLWASWADCLPMVFSRHHEVAVRFLVSLEGAPDTQSLGAAAAAMWSLRGTMGFEPPSWRALVEGARPGPVEPEDLEPGGVRRGWQHEAASHADRHFREHVLFDRLPPRDRAQVRSQAGPGASSALTALPTSYHTRIPAHLFRVTLFRRLRLPLPLTSHRCRCGRPIDSFGHHRASCARSGVLGQRGFALESAAARICREAGGRVTTNVLVRDLDLVAPNPLDSRRLEVVAPVWGVSARSGHDTRVRSPL